MKELIELVDKHLDEYISVIYPEDIFKAMKYTLSLPGKRLRPVMCLETARILGAEIEKAMPFISVMPLRVAVRKTIPMNTAPEIITDGASPPLKSNLLKLFKEYMTATDSVNVTSTHISSERTTANCTVWHTSADSARREMCLRALPVYLHPSAIIYAKRGKEILPTHLSHSTPGKKNRPI